MVIKFNINVAGCTRVASTHIILQKKDLILYHMTLYNVCPAKVFLKTQHNLSFPLQLY